MDFEQWFSMSFGLITGKWLPFNIEFEESYEEFEFDEEEWE